MMKITGLSQLFKWENLHNWWLTKYFFAPLYIHSHDKCTWGEFCFKLMQGGSLVTITNAFGFICSEYLCVGWVHTATAVPHNFMHRIKSAWVRIPHSPGNDGEKEEQNLLYCDIACVMVGCNCLSEHCQPLMVLTAMCCPSFFYKSVCLWGRSTSSACVCLCTCVCLCSSSQPWTITDMGECGTVRYAMLVDSQVNIQYNRPSLKNSVWFSQIRQLECQWSIDFCAFIIWMVSTDDKGGGHSLFLF